MPELPNIKAEILRYVIEQVIEGEQNVAHLRDFADQNEYSRRRVGRKASECSSLTCGVSPMGSWPVSEDAVYEELDEVTT